MGLALICPITIQVKGCSFEVQIPSGLEVTGVILSDQIKSLDWRAREAEFIYAFPKTILSEVLQKGNILLLPAGEDIQHREN